MAEVFFGKTIEYTYILLFIILLLYMFKDQQPTKNVSCSSKYEMQQWVLEFYISFQSCYGNDRISDISNQKQEMSNPS